MNIPKEKTMDIKAIIREMREEMWKGKEDRWLKKTKKMGTIVNWAIQRIMDKCFRTQFVAIWIQAIVKEVMENFTNIFRQAYE